MTRHLLSQLAHVEILSPRPAETVVFFEDQLGLEISERRGQSVYLRGWGEFFHHSVKVAEAARPGLGHVGWRAESAEDFYLRELGGNRIELYTGETSSSPLIGNPSAGSPRNPLAYWGGVVPQSMYTYVTPPVDMQQSRHSPATAGPGPWAAE